MKRLLGIFSIPLEEPKQPEVQIEKYRDHHGGYQGNHQQFPGLFAFTEGQDQGGQVEKRDDDNCAKSEDPFEFLIHKSSFFLNTDRKIRPKIVLL